MARWTRNHKLELGLLMGIIGLAGTVIAFWLRFADATPSALQWYADLVRRPEGDWNTLMIIVAPILLIIGGFYVGEQVVLRRRFDRLLDTPKRSEFSSRRTDLEDLSKRLPDGYKERIKAKENEFVSKRA